MRKKEFRPIGLQGKSRNTLSIQRFGGLDYSTPKFLMQDGKAIDELNYIYKNGVLQKRNGFEELFKLRTFNYLVKPFDNEEQDLRPKTNATNFNGLWSFIAEDKKTHVVAHIGHILYEIKDNQATPLVHLEEKKQAEDGKQYVLAYEFENYKSSAFVGEYKLWFLGGNKYMVLRFFSDGSFIFEPVEDSDLATIPTTTMSITYSDSRVTKRQSLDKTNLLSSMRRNKLISGTLKKEELLEATTYYEYPLDSKITTKNGEKDMSKFRMTLEERGVITNEN